MKIIAFILLGILTTIVFFSCKKDNSSTAGIASFTIINAVQGSDPFIADPNGADSVAAYFSTTPQIGYGASQEYSLVSGNIPLVVYDIADTVNAVFRNTLSLKGNNIYSLFLAGVYSSNAQNKPDTVLNIDQIPYYGNDSSAGVRFINLSPDSKPISINLAGNPGSQTEFSSLGYKQISAFKTYSAASGVGGSYNFEIRDQASDSLLTTYSWNYILQKNNTIVISGLESNGLNLFSVNNY